MANQTVSSSLNYDSAAITGLLNGETITVNGGSLTIDSDVRWGQQEAVMGALTVSSTLGGNVLIDGTQVWEIPFSASSGNVPGLGQLGTNGVTGSLSNATGELLRIWSTSSLTPLSSGSSLPTDGFIKLRSTSGSFQSGDIVTFDGGGTITATNGGKRSWINVVGREATTITLPRLANFEIRGDWYELGTTDGTDNQIIKFPVADLCPAVQVETVSGSGEFEWWVHGGFRWLGNVASEAQTVAGTTATVDNISGPTGSLAGGQYTNGIRLRETATSAPHGTGGTFAASIVATGSLTFRTFIKKETRQWMFVQAFAPSANRYGVLVDLDAGTIIDTRTIGSPTGTSNSITSVGDGWYMIELTMNHAALANAGGLNIYLANSATPSYDANGLPTYLGSTAQGGYYIEAQIISDFPQISTDERGKFFYSNVTSGELTFAQSGSLTVGYKPPTGCRVRVPNIILSSANSSVYYRNVISTTLGTQYDLTTTSAGALLIRKACCNWYTAATNPATVTFEDSAFSLGLSLSNVAGSTNITRCAVGPSRQTVATALTIANCFSGGTITGSRFVRLLGTTSANLNAINCSISTDFTFSDCRVDMGPVLGSTPVRSATFGFAATNCDSLSFTNCSFIGGGFSLTNANNTTITSLKYADRIVGETLTTVAYSVTILTSDGVIVDGIESFANLPNVHPYGGFLSTNTSAGNIELKNIGHPTASFNGGAVNLMGLHAALLGTTKGVTLRRIYGENMRTAAVSSVNTIQNLRMYNVWADGGDSQVMVAVDALSQGCRWTNPSTAQTAVYGTHWEDAFVSETDGRLMIIGNEPITSTLNQCSASFGLGAGFTAGGSISLPNLTDTVEWTMPYYALGHTSIARFSSSLFTNPWLVTGTLAQYLEFEYQMDSGSGFSGWKHLFNQTRRASGGTSGTDTVTLNATERPAMLRQPQVGDFVQTGTNRLPIGTTVTDLTGNVLTVSNNFTSNMTTNEAVFFWKDIADEVIDPNTGYKLKVRVKVNTADPTTVFSFLRIPFDTNATAQQIQYPLPVTQNIGSVTNIRDGSRIRVFNSSSNTEIANEVVSGTSWTYPYDEGTDFTDGDIINVRLARCLGPTATIGFESIAVAGPTGWSLFADQSDDTVYNTNGINGTTVTEFTFDYPNVEVDINDPDGTTTITRLYAWWANERTTEEGIRVLIGGLIAEDEANYRIKTSVVDLKLDNIASTGVIFTGDLRLYRDDGLAPVVSSTTGGGSITLYAGKVYTVAVGSAVTPQDKVDIIDGVWNATLASYLASGSTGIALNSASLATGGGGGTDWTNTEKTQIRYRLGIDGTAAAPTATGSLDVINDGVKNASLLIPHTTDL